MKRKAGVMVVLLLASGCAQLPKAELQAYSDAYQATRSAAEPMLADYAVAERDLRLAEMKRERDPANLGFFATFRPSDAQALSTIELPPGAAAIDRSFRAIGHYNDTLVALATNRNLDEARAQLGQVIDSLGGAVPGAAAAVAPVKAAAQLLADALAPAIAADNREQFKRIVLAGEPHVQKLIDTLRDYTPTQYSITTRALRLKAEQDPPVPDRAAVIERMNAWQHAFADYVVLLGAMKGRLADLRAAVEHPKAQPLLARAVAGSAELRAYAETLRLSLARVRAAA